MKCGRTDTTCVMYEYVQFMLFKHMKCVNELVRLDSYSVDASILFSYYYVLSYVYNELSKDMPRYKYCGM
jgi:hypothetical protein